MTVSSSGCCVLATDLDGTFIPLDGDIEAERSLRLIKSALASPPTNSQVDQSRQAGRAFPLLFVTGRHYDSVLDAIRESSLPIPDWILCDVGTSFFRRVTEADQPNGFVRVAAYDHELATIAGDGLSQPIRDAMAGLPGFRLQEPFKQGMHKLSFYVPQSNLEACHSTVEAFIEQRGLKLSVVSSVDPFNGDGLVDVLPKDVSKAFALRWWCEQENLSKTNILFCGDSGNDFAALVDGYNAVVVGNADRALAREVQQSHRQRGWNDRLFLAEQTSTGGVLEAMRWFGMLPAETNQCTPNNISSEPHSNDAFQDFAFGAVPTGHRRVTFGLWAPEHQSIEVELVNDAGDSLRREPMQASEDGRHAVSLDDVTVGARYRYRLSDGTSVSDPASRFQPDGVTGPSAVVDPSFAWCFDSKQDQMNRPQRPEDLILYECHLAALTDAGTFQSAIDRLDELVHLGVTAIELMPLNGCPGQWNWGYDGVHWFAPMNALGTPYDLRCFVDEAHRRGLAVIVDVVYNHFGPEGNVMPKLGGYVSPRHGTVWGSAPNFDDEPQASWMRRFVVDNAIMWLHEYRMDGLRVDAIHCMADESSKHMVSELAEAVRMWAREQDRHVWLIAETNVYDREMTGSVDDGGFGFDAQWNDDFLHSVFAAVRPGEQLTTRVYQPRHDLAETLERGCVFQGGVRGFRGRVTDPQSTTGELQKPEISINATSSVTARFSQVVCIQNHDFIGNHPLGNRLHQLTSLETHAAAAALMLMLPSIPMLFMGEEFACEHPFNFFVDFADDATRRGVVEGRRREYPQHDWSEGRSPIDPETFKASKIGDASQGNSSMRTWYQTLIRFRRDGIQGGWLSSHILDVCTDTETSTYRLDYYGRDQQCSVVTRLLPIDASQPPLPWIDVPGDKLPLKRVLDSNLAIQSDAKTDSDHLFPNQTVIWLGSK